MCRALDIMFEIAEPAAAVVEELQAWQGHATCLAAFMRRWIELRDAMMGMKGDERDGCARKTANGAFYVAGFL